MTCKRHYRTATRQLISGSLRNAIISGYLALSSGKMPGRELADAMLVLIGGTLLLTPGFLTDIVGFFFILPFTRPITRRWLQRVVERRLVGGSGIVRGEVI